MGQSVLSYNTFVNQNNGTKSKCNLYVTVMKRTLLFTAGAWQKVKPPCFSLYTVFSWIV